MSFSKHLEHIAQEALYALGANPIAQYHHERHKMGQGSLFTFRPQQAPSDVWCAFPTQLIRRLVYEGATPEVPVVIHIQTVKECAKTPSGNVKIQTKQTVSRLSYYHLDKNGWKHFREVGTLRDEPYYLDSENIFYAKAPQQLTATFSKDVNIPLHWAAGKQHKSQHGAIADHYR